MTAIIVKFRGDFSIKRWFLHEMRDENKPSRLSGLLGITARTG